jgi:dihydrofolate reductase
MTGPVRSNRQQAPKTSPGRPAAWHAPGEETVGDQAPEAVGKDVRGNPLFGSFLQVADVLPNMTSRRTGSQQRSPITSTAALIALPERGWPDPRVTIPCRRYGLPSPATVGTTACNSQSLRRFAVPDTTCHMSMSLDGFVAGPDQSREDPLGKRGLDLHGWHIGDPRANDADKVANEWLMRPRGAYVMGRNMFGPIRGDWDEEWTGWWGPEPPYHAPVFVLTHHGHDPIQMDGGTTFHFVTAGFDAAYSAACQAAGDNGVDIAGGASTVRQALIAGVIDELTLDIAPVLLGSGERIFDGVESFGFEPAEVLHSPLTTHIRYRRVR